MATWIKAPDSGGTCCDCQPAVCDDCECPDPTLVCDSISASKTKCGFAEYGTPSSPPKKYRIRTLSGSVTIEFFGSGDSSCGSCVDKSVSDFSGACTYATPACTLTESGSVTNTGYSDCASVGSTETCSRCVLFSLGSCFFDSGDTALFSVSSSSTVLTVAGTATCVSGGSFYAKATGSAYETLSDEYTTSDLIADAVASLPSYPGTWAGTCSAYRDLTSNELTYTIRRFKYYFELPDLTGITCYSLAWNEGATPRTYTWNGTDTETPTYEVNEPGSNGTTAITDLVVSCACP